MSAILAVVRSFKNRSTSEAGMESVTVSVESGGNGVAGGGDCAGNGALNPHPPSNNTTARNAEPELKVFLIGLNAIVPRSNLPGRTPCITLLDGELPAKFPANMISKQMVSHDRHCNYREHVFGAGRHGYLVPEIGNVEVIGIEIEARDYAASILTLEGDFH